MAGREVPPALGQEYNGISAMGLMDFTEEHRRLVHQAYAEAVIPPR